MSAREKTPPDFAGLPGAALIAKGLADLTAERISEESLLVLIATDRLGRLGINVPESKAPRPREHALYSLLEERYDRGAHSRYNALLRTLNSFAAALEREASARRAATGSAD